jgi:hypothetical protein
MEVSAKRKVVSWSEDQSKQDWDLSQYGRARRNDEHREARSAPHAKHPRNGNQLRDATFLGQAHQYFTNTNTDASCTSATGKSSQMGSDWRPGRSGVGSLALAVNRLS